MLHALQRDLKALVAANRHGELFRRLSNCLHAGCALYNKIAIPQARYFNVHTEYEEGRINYELYAQEINKITPNLLQLINEISFTDLAEPYRQRVAEHKHIPLFHAYTCDRVAQNDLFQLRYYDAPDPDEKVHIFYLYGDARQEMHTLFQRLGYEIGGHLLNWEKGDYNPGTRLKFFQCKPQVSDSPQLFRLNIMRELLARFFEPVNSQQPILEKKISHLCGSEYLRDFGPNDLVFILLTIDDNNWRERVTAAVVKELVKNFCLCDPLPPEAPHFFFFFGIEYSRENEAVKTQVRKAIEEREYGEVLPELGPVAFEDVAEWFSRYHVFKRLGFTPADNARNHFGPFKEKDMSEVVLKLRELIEQHNLGIIH